MNQLIKIFDGHELTIVEKDNEPLFRLGDVCKILDLGQVAGVTRRLDDEVISNHPIKDRLGRTQQATFVNEDGLYDVILDSRKQEARRFRKWITSEVLPSIRKTGSYNTIDTSQLSPELQILNNMVASLARQELETKRIKSEQETIKHRLDNIDSLDTIGDLQQRLNAMIRRYAQQEGIGFGNAWKSFRQAYNTAYRTNLTLRINNYKKDHNLKNLTMPQYLSIVRELPDAIRVADKMLNRSVAS